MTAWLPGMKITAARLNDFTATASTTSGLTAATNFSVNSFQGRKVSGVTTVQVYVQYTGAGITATSDNIADTTCCTLPSGYRPQEIITTNWDTGSSEGGCIINTDGTIVLRTAGASIATNNNIRISGSWISENN